MAKRTVDVIIPTYRPDRRFEKLIERLQHQTVRPMRILVVNTQAPAWVLSSALEKLFAAKKTPNGIPFIVTEVAPQKFDHGGTRDAAAAQSQADVLLFMTQDAVPADEYLIERLLAAFSDGPAERGCVAAAYARQLPQEDCGVLERYARAFNYGETSLVKSEKDLPRLGVKTYFCSNVCAAYLREVYQKLGGFEKHTIFNEDMIFCGHLVKAGYQIAYAADAKVYHSHNYSGLQQLHRNFDLAVSQAEHPEVFAHIRSEGEGLRLIRQESAWLCKSGRVYLLPKLVWQSGCKYLGYLLGKNYRRLPAALVRALSMNKKYWENKVF